MTSQITHRCRPFSRRHQYHIIMLLLTAAATALQAPARAPPPPPRYEALEGGRPPTAKRIGRPAFARLIRRATHPDAEPARVWLDLANGESLVVGFEPCSDFSGSCTMRVRQTRVAGECSLDNPEGCNDAGCVAVRWDLRTGEGVLLDLFKAKAGERLGCDISSADDGGVRWGRLMMRVVDDVAAVVGAHAARRAASRRRWRPGASAPPAPGPEATAALPGSRARERTHRGPWRSVARPHRAWRGVRPA
jgi:hypothetical protein